MNIDLIIKLAKLANENPNDNEANLAARKVCSLIKSGEYKFNNSTTNTQTRPQAQRQSDVRSASSSGPFRDYGFDWFYWDELSKDPYKNQKSYYDKSYSGPFDPNSDYYKYYVDPITGQKKKEEKPKRNLKCKTCRQEIMTAFVGLEMMFECYKCQWSGYEEKREKE